MPSLSAIHGANSLDYPDGYLVLTRGIGHDPTNRSGENFRRFPHIKIVRLNNGYGPEQGTLPEPPFYTAFAQRCAHFVEMSPGCTRWIIGNEPNLTSVEAPNGVPISAADYAECYTLCRDAIKALPGHADDEVLVAAIGPWNVESGDWVRYFEDIQHELALGGCDGFALHTYAREQTADSITDTARMDPPYEFYHNGFRTYTDWMAAILPRFRGLPCYITEFCIAGEPWENVDTGCVRQAYQDIFTWNKLHPGQPIHCLAMYRWEYDRWAFNDKPGVIQDFYTAVACGYSWPPLAELPEPEPPEEETMLLNPSFEEGWHNQDDQGELVLPDDWSVEYRDGNAPYKRPEVKPNQEFVTDGQFSIRAFPPAHSRGFYGIYQDVMTEPGQWYRFSADVRTESSPPGKLGAMVGIQPWGGSVFHRQMIWGEEIVNSHNWTRVEVIAPSYGGRIRVVMGADNEFATSNNTTWWDNAQLELWEWDVEPEPPEPEPPDPEPPEPGEPVDYARIEEIVQDAIAARDPIVWPKL